MPHHPTRTASSRRVLALDFIRTFFFEHGSSPSLDEIGAAVRAPKQRVVGMLRELEARGDIVVRRGQSRGIELPSRLSNFSTIEIRAELRRREMLERGVAALPVAAIYDDIVDQGVTESELTLLAKLDDVP